MTPDQLQAELAKVRAEAAKHRVSANDATTALEALRNSLAKALGLKTDGSEDPEKVIVDLQSKYRQERLHNSFLRAAAEVKADAGLAWAVISTNGKLDKFSPDSETLDADMIKEVREMVKANPKLSTTEPPKNSGGEVTGGTQGGKVDMNTLIRGGFRR